MTGRTADRLAAAFALGLVALVLFGIVVFAIKSVTDDGGEEQWQKCLDRGGVVILDRYGEFDGCEIGRVRGG